MGFVGLAGNDGRVGRSDAKNDVDNSEVVVMRVVKSDVIVILWSVVCDSAVGVLVVT